MPASSLVSDLHADSVRRFGADRSRSPIGATISCCRRSTIRGALDLFERSEADVLPVLADAQSRRIVGKLSEAHALREYGRELEKRNRESRSMRLNRAFQSARFALKCDIS